MAPTKDLKKKPKQTRKTSAERARDQLGGQTPKDPNKPKGFPRKIVNSRLEELKLDSDIATSDVYFCQRQLPRQVWKPALKDDVPRCMQPLGAPLSVFISKRGPTYPPDHDAHRLAVKRHKNENRSHEYYDFGPFGGMPWFKSGKRRGVLGYDRGEESLFKDSTDKPLKAKIKYDVGTPRKRKPFFAGVAEEEKERNRRLQEAMLAKNDFERKRQLLDKIEQMKRLAVKKEETEVDSSSESSVDQSTDFAGVFASTMFLEYQDLGGNLSKSEFMNLGGPMFLYKCKNEGENLDECIKKEASESYKNYRMVGGSMSQDDFMRRGGPLLSLKCISLRSRMLIDECIKRDVDKLYELYGKLQGTVSFKEFLSFGGPMLMLLLLSKMRPKRDICTIDRPCMLEECEFTRRFWLKYGDVCSYYRSCMLDECEFTNKTAPNCVGSEGGVRCSLERSCMTDQCGWTEKVKAKQRSLCKLRAPKNVCSKDRSCMYERCEWTKLAKRKEMTEQCVTGNRVCLKDEPCMHDECKYKTKNKGKINSKKKKSVSSKYESRMKADRQSVERPTNECTINQPCYQDECGFTNKYRIKMKAKEIGPCREEDSCMMEECEWTKIGLSRGRNIWRAKDLMKLPQDMSYTEYKSRGGTMSRLEFMWQAGPMSFEEYRNRGGSLTREEFSKFGVPLSYKEYERLGGALTKRDFLRQINPITYEEYAKRGGSMSPEDFKKEIRAIEFEKSGKHKFEDISGLFGDKVTHSGDDYYDPIKDIERLDKYWQIFDRIQLRAYERQKEKMAKKEMEEKIEAREKSSESSSTTSLSSSSKS